ncbi:tetratricopeptide repeat protein [Polyangium aurulentum]|uniref:tetratricopeptide repeat protein n=1 Tax=Polyangium aurulentum TaxID=2567896 RepID=UPI0010AEB4C5|nr:tetratricopeptide repeat protein [Polyangium aurulentum]UQA56036.1 tetratricopeptide repeat protein [Polyangium aurulentum]
MLPPHRRVRTALQSAAIALAIASALPAAHAEEPGWSTAQAAELTRQAVAHAESGDRSAAAKRFLEAIRFDPTYGPAYLGLAALHEASGDVVEAERVYQMGLERVARFSAGHLARARLRKRTGRLADAANDLEAARALAPDDPALLGELCATYISLGALPAALDASRRLEALAEARGDTGALKESRVRSRALANLIAEADPVTAGGQERGLVRRAIALRARRAR